MRSGPNIIKLVVGVIVAMWAFTGVSDAATRTVTVSKAGNGSGTVVSQGSAAINCGSTCSASIPDGAIVTLVATASPGTRLNGFSGTPCYRVGNTCQVVIWGSDVSITATFVQVQPLTVNFGGTGDGQVTSAPAGTDCIATCTVDHETGSTVTLSAAPRNFSRFGGWSGGGCSGFATCVVSMDAAKSVTATFIPLRQLRVEVPRVPDLSPGGRISSTPAGINGCTFCAANFDLGQTVKLTAVADENWDFDGWRGDRCNGVTTPTCDVTVDWGADVKPIVRASFRPRHLLTVATQGSGTVTSSPVGINCGATCSARFRYGERITLTPQAAAGYRFASWTGCTSGAFSNPCVHQPGTDTTVTANFVEVESVADHVLAVTLAGTGEGSVWDNQASIRCPGTCEASYRAGTTVTLNAQSGGGASAFAGWSGAGCSGTGTCTVTLNQATHVTATFAATRGTLNIAKTGGGTGTVTSQMNWINCGATCSRVFTAGEKLTLTATPGPNSLFAGWSGGGCSGKGPCEVTMDRTKTVTATFVPGSTLRIVYEGRGEGAVTALPSGAECTSGTCVVEHDLGTVVTLTATPKPGTRFAYWFGGDCDYSTSRTCTTTLNSDTEISARFLKQFTLNVSRAGDGLGIVTAHEATPGIDCGATCTVVKGEGTEMVLFATAYAGSKFVGWSGGGEFCDTDPECALPMYSDYSLTATFVRDTLQPDPTPDPGGITPPAGGNPPAPGGTTAAPSVSPPTQPSKLRFVATGTRRGKQVNLRLRFTGAPAGKLAVTVRLYSGRKLVARSGATVRSGQARVTLRSKNAVRKGRYRVLVSVGKTKLAPVPLGLR